MFDSLPERFNTVMNVLLNAEKPLRAFEVAQRVSNIEVISVLNEIDLLGLVDVAWPPPSPMRGMTPQTHRLKGEVKKEILNLRPAQRKSLYVYFYREAPHQL